MQFGFTQELLSEAAAGVLRSQPHQYMNWLVGAALAAPSQCLHSYI